MKIETERLILREIDRTDLEAIHQLHSVPEVDEFNTLGIPENLKETLQIMEPILKNQKASVRKHYSWMIFSKKTGEFLGLAGLTLSADRFRLGEIYYKFFPEFWGKGYATEVSKVLIKCGFEYFSLHKMEAGVAVENFRSIRVLEKSGMIREGLRRKILPIRGEWVDCYLYAIIEDDPRIDCMMNII